MKTEDLGSRLNNFPEINRYDTKGEKEGFSMAYSLLELQQSFNKVSMGLIPKLGAKNLTKEETINLLHELGEEFRHILYHIKDMKYYDYLFPVEDTRA